MILCSHLTIDAGPSTEDDEIGYIALFSYLHTRERSGVVGKLPSHIKVCCYVRIFMHA